ncbi:MAG TPA: HAD-IA family hydrolase [Jatrophihabitans sp.]|jgi:sugar-phosphatase
MRLLPAAAILFDCDGVLVDSDASVYSAWRRWALAQELDPDEVSDVVHGRRAADTVAALLPPERRAGAELLINAYEVDDAGAVTAIAGAAELVAAVPCWAVVTSGRRELAIARLRAAGLPVPPVLVTAEDVRHGKPHPEGYLAGARGLGIDPADTIVVEDAAAGIAAARAAGVGAVVGIGRPGLDTDAWTADLTGLRWTGSGLTVS